MLTAILTNSTVQVSSLNLYKYFKILPLMQNSPPPNRRKSVKSVLNSLSDLKAFFTSKDQCETNIILLKMMLLNFLLNTPPQALAHKIPFQQSADSYQQKFRQFKRKCKNNWKVIVHLVLINFSNYSSE